MRESRRSGRNATVPDAQVKTVEKAGSAAPSKLGAQHPSRQAAQGKENAGPQPNSANLRAKAAPAAAAKAPSGGNSDSKDEAMADACVKVSLASGSSGKGSAEPPAETSGDKEDDEDDDFQQPKGKALAPPAATRGRGRPPGRKAAPAPRRSTRAGVDQTKLRLKAQAVDAASTGSDDSQDIADGSGSGSGSGSGGVSPSSDDAEEAPTAAAARKRRATAAGPPPRRGQRERVQAVIFSVKHEATRKRRARSASPDDDDDDESSSSGSDAEDKEDGQEDAEEEEEAGERVPVIRPAFGAAKAKPTKAAAPSTSKAAAAAARVQERANALLASRVQVVLERDLPQGDRFLCKMQGSSYRKLQWVTRAMLDAYRPQHLRIYLDKARAGHKPENAAEWQVAERIVAQRRAPVAGAPKVPVSQQPLEYLVKWQGLDYQHSTWEPAQELLASDTDKVLVTRFNKWTAKRPHAQPTLHNLRAKLRATPAKGPAPAADAGAAAGADVTSPRADQGEGSGLAVAGGTPARTAVGLAEAQLDASFDMPIFLNNRSLRDYQEKSVRWMVNNFAHLHNGQLEPINCILGDEMGLGKTAQSISALEVLRRVGGIPGPFLVVAPLTTLGHWQREIQTWTDMNVVLYTGDAEDRALIQEHEFMNPDHPNQCKFDVLLCAYDMLLRDHHTFKRFSWQAAILDEAHKLKSFNSSTRAAVTGLDIQWKLLLTGTPIQNNMGELFSMMNLLAPDEYDTVATFHDHFGGGKTQPTVAQIQKLQDVLRPILLRRMKEDVENLPEKEEVIIWVTMTNEQRAYYKALYTGQIGALLGNIKNANLPGMRNLAMELRKICCHPFLCNGMEDDMLSRWEAAGLEGQQCSQAALLERASGKMMLLGKLLPKLRAEGKKVLIFSQFKIMLNVIEDYLGHQGYPCERIDGDTKGRDRQKAIDRFMEVDDDGFIFLLSTRAGGQGITLTSADTIIIYDSDWNPQNDLQAMARCHRIGQSKEVKVYRLITKDTYEERVFDVASKKYGLDEAILGFSAGNDPEADAGRIAGLLQNGAHCLVDDGAAAAADAFAAEGIDQILAGRSEKRQIGTKAGNTFSTARFAVEDQDEGDGEGAGDGPALTGAAAKRQKKDKDRAVWASLLPDAVKAYEEKLNAPLAARVRGPVNYTNAAPVKVDKPKKAARDPDDSSDDGNTVEEVDDEEAAAAKKASKSRKILKPPPPVVPKRWTNAQVATVADRLMSLGGGDCWERLHREVLFKPVRSLEEMTEVCVLLAGLIAVTADLGDVQAKAAAVIKEKADAEAAAKAAKEAERAQLAASLLASGAPPPPAPRVTRQATAAETEEKAGAETVRMRDLVTEQLEEHVQGMQVPDLVAACLTKQTLQRLSRGALTLRASLAECRALHAMLDKQDANVAAAEAATAAGQPEEQAVPQPASRPRLVPQLPKKGVPDWWTAQHDEDLLVGAGRHGYHHASGTKAAVQLTLTDPTLSFVARVAPEPVAEDPAAADGAAAAAGAAAADGAVGGAAAPMEVDLTAASPAKPPATVAALPASPVRPLVAAVAAASPAKARAAASPAKLSAAEALAAVVRGVFTLKDLRRQASAHYVPKQLLEAIPGDVKLGDDVDMGTLVLDHVVDTSEASPMFPEPQAMVKFAGYTARWRKTTLVAECPTYLAALAAHQARCAVVLGLLAAPRPPPESLGNVREAPGAAKAAAKATAAAAKAAAAIAAEEAAAAAAAAMPQKLLSPAEWRTLVGQVSKRMRTVVMAALDPSHPSLAPKPVKQPLQRPPRPAKAAAAVMPGGQDISRLLAGQVAGQQAALANGSGASLDKVEAASSDGDDAFVTAPPPAAGKRPAGGSPVDPSGTAPAKKAKLAATASAAEAAAGAATQPVLLPAKAAATKVVVKPRPQAVAHTLGGSSAGASGSGTQQPAATPAAAAPAKASKLGVLPLVPVPSPKCALAGVVPVAAAATGGVPAAAGAGKAAVKSRAPKAAQAPSKFKQSTLSFTATPSATKAAAKSPKPTAAAEEVVILD